MGTGPIRAMNRADSPKVRASIPYATGSSTTLTSTPAVFSDDEPLALSQQPSDIALEQVVPLVRESLLVVLEQLVGLHEHELPLGLDSTDGFVEDGTAPLAQAAAESLAEDLHAVRVPGEEDHVVAGLMLRLLLDVGEQPEQPSAAHNRSR